MYSGVETAIDSVILESYIQCGSTINVMNVVKSLGIENVSASYVSSLASALDENVQLFPERDIDRPMKFIYIGVTYVMVGDEEKYRGKALYVCIGIDNEGKIEILSSKLYDPETVRE